MIDKRKYVRLSEKISIKFQIITLGGDPVAHINLMGAGYSANISEGGVLVEVGDPVPVGTFLEVQLEGEELAAPIVLKGRVTHLAEAAGYNRYEIGIQFTHFFEKDREELMKHLKELAAVLFGN